MTNQYVPTLRTHTRKPRNIGGQGDHPLFAQQHQEQAQVPQQKQQDTTEAVSRMMNPQADMSDQPMDFGTSMEDM